MLVKLNNLQPQPVRRTLAVGLIPNQPKGSTTDYCQRIMIVAWIHMTMQNRKKRLSLLGKCSYCQLFMRYILSLKSGLSHTNGRDI